MEEIIKSLFPDGCYHEYNLEETNDKVYYFVANKDKIVFITSISSLDDIDTYTNRLPELRKYIFKEFIKKDNNLYVNQLGKLDNKENSLSMPAFLWDLYIIGLHRYDKSIKPFKIDDIERIKRDQFIARKIIIEYRDLKELSEKFREYIFPNEILKEKLNSIEPPSIDINDLLKDIEESLVIRKEGDKDLQISSEDIIQYLDCILDEYIEKR